MIIVIALLFSGVCFADNIHKVEKGETVWFLAELYYGEGAKYQEILKSNNLKRPEDLKVGLEVVLPLPKYSNKAADFKDRYQQILAKRKSSDRESLKSLMKPDLKGKSPQEAAKEELKRSAGH